MTLLVPLVAPIVPLVSLVILVSLELLPRPVIVTTDEGVTFFASVSQPLLFMVCGLTPTREHECEGTSDSTFR